LSWPQYRDRDSVAGNMLAGERSYARPRGFRQGGRQAARRAAPAALEAGEAASAATSAASNPPRSGSSRPRPGRSLDLRVDDHPDPLPELRRIYAVSRLRWAISAASCDAREHPGVFDRA
jgi:uncharacterized Ntn-hydrolase superfamily protein